MKKEVFNIIKKNTTIYRLLFSLYFYVKQITKKDINQFYIYYKKLNFIFSVVPKNGNSTLNSMILDKLNIKPSDEKEYAEIHKVKREFVIDRKKVLKKVEGRNCHVFAISRNPFSRLVSCYENKIKNENYQMKKAYFGKFYTAMSFKEFVLAVSNIPDIVSDPHFRSQHSILFYKDRPLFNEIRKLENPKVYEPVIKKYDLEPKAMVNSSKYKKSWPDYYDNELVELVYERYKKDFIFFDYDSEYKKLKEHLSCRP